ncbi:MAG: hypothetical protein FWE45_00615 [Firmicutes bacterium]|nr:hypothetical protein [Bacillota bacterium]
MSKNVENSTKSNLTLENRQSLSITGIKKIRTTEPAQVVADLDNCTIVVNGNNLSIENLSVKEGNLDIVGSITSIRYVTSINKRWSFKNIFR